MGVMKRIEQVLRAIDVAIALAKVVVAVMAAFVGFAVVAVTLAAYLKREQWTKPAYRWARDTSGRWNRTPWTSPDSNAG
ncbi:MAG: hypothetical protein ACXVP1_06650 [Thermoleophilia bacterium]